MSGEVARVGPSLEFLEEPTLIVDLEGKVRGMNSAACDRLGVGAEPVNLSEIVARDKEAAAAVVRRASRSTSLHVGAFTIAGDEGEERVRVHAARLQSDRDGETLVIVRLMPFENDRFRILNRRLEEIDRQLHKRVHENALLQEALAENKVLVRELQHRVKNNVQQMLSLISMSADKRPPPSVGEVVSTASDRLRAMAFTQEAIYQNARAGALSARSFLEDVIRGTAASHSASEALVVSVQDGAMTPDEAHCLALIANELLANAIKHGSSKEMAMVWATFACTSEGFIFEVADNGPGFHEAAVSRSSGLALVRGLSRQIGASLEITNDDGARCRVSFRSELV